MRGEVIAIGDELTTGQRLDTNSQWLSARLTEMGVEVAFHTTVGDELGDNVAVFRAALQRADVVVVTGGLGPTADDLTREALAAALEMPLVRDAAAEAHIESLFARRGRSMPQRNRMQADFPQGAQPIPNPHGTAPGIAISVERTGRTPCSVFALPGVPAEMHAMWEESVLPAIHRLETSPRVTRHCRVKCFGVGESHLEAMLPDLFRRGREPRVGITVSDATITLRITASAATEAECFAAMDPTVATIHESLGDLVFGAEDDELEHAVVRLLNEKKLTLATAEWATEGLLAQWLSEVTGGKPPLLKATIVASSEKFGAAEPHAAATALAMAERVREEAGSDWGLAVAAYPADVDTADAHVCAAIATAERTRKLRFPTAAHPAILRSRTAKQALNALRLTLLGKV